MNLDLNRSILHRQEELSKILVNMSKILTTQKNASKSDDLKLLNKQYKSKIHEIDLLLKEKNKLNKGRKI